MTTTANPALLDVVTWEAPRHLNARGTLFLLAGRGETPEVYQRFATRLSVDAYRVVVISATDHLDPQAAAEIRALVADPDQPGPKILVGSDAGARAALELAGSAEVDAVITAGLPVTGPGGQRDWQSEISARTSCPNHQQVLQHSTRHSLLHALPAVRLTAAAAEPLTVPVLAIHGAADQLSPLPEALAWYAKARVSNVWVVDGGLHDILNDVTHRSVAATIVLFLERLRLGASLPIIIAPAAAADATVTRKPA
jgi:alpha-beta hydrolase superfamily lysophospholipase